MMIEELDEMIEEFVNGIREEMKKMRAWLDNADSLTLSRLKNDAYYLGIKAESFSRNNKNIPKKDDLQWVVDLFIERFHYDYAFIAYRIYSRRLEKELEKN